jgi:hypothetical protein
MSTDYRPLKDISACEMFDGGLEAFGVREHIANDTTEKTRFLTDGRNYLNVDVSPEGMVMYLTRRGANAPQKILNAIAKAFDTEIVSEYEQWRFWGFESEEAFNVWMEDQAKCDQEALYADVLRYVRGEAHSLVPGTLGMGWANEMKERVSKSPDLLLPEKENEFRAALKQIVDRQDNVVTVELSEKDLAFVDMIATHEDDLPSA